MQGTGVMTYGRARPDDLPRTKTLMDEESLSGLRVIEATAGLTGTEETVHVHPATVSDSPRHRQRER